MDNCNVCLNEYPVYKLQNTRYCCTAKICKDCQDRCISCPVCRAEADNDALIRLQEELAEAKLELEEAEGTIASLEAFADEKIKVLAVENNRLRNDLNISISRIETYQVEHGQQKSVDLTPRLDFVDGGHIWGFDGLNFRNPREEACGFYNDVYVDVEDERIDVEDMCDFGHAIMIVPASRLTGIINDRYMHQDNLSIHYNEDGCIWVPGASDFEDAVELFESDLFELT